MVHQLWESDAQHDGHEGTDHLKRHRHTPEQIVRTLREGERLLNEGKDLTEVVRHLGVAESTWNLWRSQYGGMKADEAKRLRQLDSENAKKLLAEAELDKAMPVSMAAARGRPPASAFESEDRSGCMQASDLRC